MTDRPYRMVPNPDDRRFTFKMKLQPPSPGEKRALEIYYAGLARWLEERRRQRGDQADTTS